MANTTLTQTGAQVQAILDKADKLPSSLGTAGQVLTVNSGATAAEWQTPSGGGTGYNGELRLGYSGLYAFVIRANGTCTFIDTYGVGVSLSNVSLVIVINGGHDALGMCSFSYVNGYYQSKTGGHYQITSGNMNSFATAFICPYANNFEIDLDD